VMLPFGTNGIKSMVQRIKTCLYEHDTKHEVGVQAALTLSSNS